MAPCCLYVQDIVIMKCIILFNLISSDFYYFFCYCLCYGQDSILRSCCQIYEDTFQRWVQCPALLTIITDELNSKVLDNGQTALHVGRDRNHGRLRPPIFRANIQDIFRIKVVDVIRTKLLKSFITRSLFLREIRPSVIFMQFTIFCFDALLPQYLRLN